MLKFSLKYQVKNAIARSAMPRIWSGLRRVPACLISAKFANDVLQFVLQRVLSLSFGGPQAGTRDRQQAAALREVLLLRV